MYKYILIQLLSRKITIYNVNVKLMFLGPLYKYMYMYMLSHIIFCQKFLGRGIMCSNVGLILNRVGWEGAKKK